MANREMPSPDELRKQYPGNSYKQRDSQNDISPSESKPEVKQIAKGKVRKQSLLKKFTKYIIEDSIESAKEKTLGDIIIPGVKTLIFDTLTDMLDIILFGGNGAPMGRYSASPRSRKSGQTSYNKFYDDKSNRTGNGGRTMAYRDAPYDPDDIILDTRAQANDVLNELNYIIQKYGQASIANFYDIVGVTGEWTDNRYGWTSLRGAAIKPVRDGFMVILPPTIVLED